MSDTITQSSFLEEIHNYSDNYWIRTFDDLLQCDGCTMSLDTETTGLEWWEKKIIGLGFYCKSKNLGGYIPTPESYDRKTASDIVNSFSKDSTIIFHNAKFDMHFIGVNISKIKWTVMDTTVMVHLVDSRDSKALKNAELEYLGTESKRAHVDAAPARTKIWDWPTRILSAYCANDCIVTYQLCEVLWAKLEEWGLQELFWKDMTYMKDIYRTEEYGVLLNTDFVYRSAAKLEKHLEKMEEQLLDSCGRSFNWRSPKQLSDAIYGGLGIPKPKNPFADADGVDRSRFAEAGKYKSNCTATFILTEKVHHPLGALISSMRETDKLRKNYLKWLELMDDNNVLHTTFNQTGTRTGRLSSSKPNLQNVASNVRGRFTQSVFTGDIARTDEYNMRKAIIARPGNLFLSVDYKQMEMRMFGILSKDPFMLDALIAGKDVHLEIALRVWGDCGYDSNMIHREWSKTISFGLIYGMTLGSLMYKLNMVRMQASKITDQYWAQFPRIKPWMNEIISTCQTFGYLRYWSGRIWREDVPEDCYKGCNALIQGGCADLLSIACMRVGNWIDQQSDPYHVVSLVHDEIITEIPEDKILYSARDIAEIMQVPDVVDIPFATDCKIGPTYGDLEKLPKDILLDESIKILSWKNLCSMVGASLAPEVIDAKFESPEEEFDEEESDE